MTRILTILADGFEELEVVAPVDIWRRGGLEVTLCSLLREVQVTGRNNMRMLAQTPLEDEVLENYDALFIPGGAPGVQKLMSHQPLSEILRSFNHKKKMLISICAGPLVLAKAGILIDHTLTCHPQTEKDISSHCQNLTQDAVVVSRNIITSRGPGTASELAFTVLALLTHPEHAEKVRKEMVFI